MELTLVARRLLANATNAPSGSDDTSSFSFETWLGTYWYILLIVLAVLVVVCVFICACALKKRPRSHSFQSHPRVIKSTDSHSPDHGGSSGQSRQSSIPTMPSLSADSTPIPSPHSSQHSVGVVNNRNRRTSPRLSSTSSDTLRPDIRSVSSTSSASLMGHSPTRQQERNSPMERRGSLPRRTRSGPMVRVTSMPDVKDGGRGRGLHPSPSTVSVESSSSGRSGVSYKFQPGNDSQTFVEVGVTVHTPGDPDKAVRIATAAALAESARKLAQEAASFIDTGDENIYNRFGPSNRPYHPGSGRSSSFSLSQPSYISTHSHPVAMTTANLDNPSTSLSRVGGGHLRGEQYPSHNSYYSSSSRGGPYQSYISDPSGRSFEYDHPLSILESPSTDHSYPRTTHSPFQRGRPFRSSLDSYRREEIPQMKDRISSANMFRETSFTSRPHPLINEERSGHRPQAGSRRFTVESNYSRKIPFHLTAAGRRQSAPSFDRKGVINDLARRTNNERFPPRFIHVPAEVEQPRETPVGSSSSSGHTADERTAERKHSSAVASCSNKTAVQLHPPLTQSPSSSTGVSSTHSSQIDEPSPYPSQENPDDEINNDYANATKNIAPPNECEELLSTANDNTTKASVTVSTEPLTISIDNKAIESSPVESINTEEEDIRSPLSKQSSNDSEESVEYENYKNSRKYFSSSDKLARHSRAAKNETIFDVNTAVPLPVKADTIPLRKPHNRSIHSVGGGLVDSRSLHRHESHHHAPLMSKKSYLPHLSNSFQSGSQLLPASQTPPTPVVDVTVNV